MRMFLTAVCLITGLVVPASADACSCQEQSVSEARAAAAAIFEGRVVAVDAMAPTGDNAPGGNLVTIEVERAWKGVSTETVTVKTASNGAICGYAFEVGTDYLVYATAEETSGYRVSLCSRTKPVSKAKRDHKVLGDEEEVFRGGKSVRYRNEHASASLSDRCTIGVAGDASRSGALALLVIGALLARRARD